MTCQINVHNVAIYSHVYKKNYSVSPGQYMLTGKSLVSENKLLIKPNVSNKNDKDVACGFAMVHTPIFVLVLNEREVISK